MKIVLLLAEAMTVLTAVVVAFHPNVLYASMALLFTFMGVAVMFLFAGADFLAGVQVIVYVGGVTILILFAIMLTEWLYQVKPFDIANKLVIPIAVAAIFFFPLLYRALSQLSETILKTPPEKLGEFSISPKTHAMGQALLGNYVLPFEAITILLLGALVGGVWLARPSK